MPCQRVRDCVFKAERAQKSSKGFRQVIWVRHESRLNGCLNSESCNETYCFTSSILPGHAVAVIAAV